MKLGVCRKLAGGEYQSISTLDFGPTWIASAERYAIEGDRLASIPYIGSGRCFLTPFQPEIAALDSLFPNWTRSDGNVIAGHSATFNVFTASVPGASPVCRFYIPPEYGDSYFYSASPDECAAVKESFPQFVLQTEAAFYTFVPDIDTGACPINTVSVYRYWNGPPHNDHCYTTNGPVRTGPLIR